MAWLTVLNFSGMSLVLGASLTSLIVALAVMMRFARGNSKTLIDAIMDPPTERPPATWLFAIAGAVGLMANPWLISTNVRWMEWTAEQLRIGFDANVAVLLVAGVEVCLLRRTVRLSRWRSLIKPSRSRVPAG